MNPNYLFCDRAGWKASTDKWTWRHHRGTEGAPTVSQGAPEVWLHHSVTTVTDDPCRDMKIIEAVGIARFGRFSYSYAVHPSGVVLEGCGHLVGAHTEGRNSTSYGIVLIGNYEHVDPGAIQIASLIDTINILRYAGHVHPRPLVRPHSDVKPTACPGELRRHLTEIRQRTR